MWRSHDGNKENKNYDIDSMCSVPQPVCIKYRAAQGGAGVQCSCFKLHHGPCLHGTDRLVEGLSGNQAIVQPGSLDQLRHVV